MNAEPKTTPPTEWANVLLDLACWKELTSDDEDDYARALLGEPDPVTGVRPGKFAEGVLREAVQRLLHAGASPFRPKAAEIIAEAVQVQWPELAPVSWTEVWSEIRAAMRSRDFPRNAPLGERSLFVGEHVARLLGPIAGNFAAATFRDLVHAPINGGERNGAAVGALRKEWDEHQTTLRGRVLRGGRVLTPAEVLGRSAERRSPLEPADTPALNRAA